MTFWPFTNSDFPTDQTFHQFHDLYTELDLHRIMSGFHGAFATSVASQQGTLTLPDTWFRPPFWDLLMLQLLRPNSSNLPCLYSTFHFEYPLVLSRFCFMYCLWANGLRNKWTWTWTCFTRRWSLKVVVRVRVRVGEKPSWEFKLLIICLFVHGFLPNLEVSILVRLEVCHTLWILPLSRYRLNLQ